MKNGCDDRQLRSIVVFPFTCLRFSFHFAEFVFFFFNFFVVFVVFHTLCDAFYSCFVTFDTFTPRVHTAKWLIVTATKQKGERKGNKLYENYTKTPNIVKFARKTAVQKSFKFKYAKNFFASENHKRHKSRKQN